MSSAAASALGYYFNPSVKNSSKGSGAVLILRLRLSCDAHT
jgi:hypothetical protein